MTILGRLLARARAVAMAAEHTGYHPRDWVTNDPRVMVSRRQLEETQRRLSCMKTWITTSRAVGPRIKKDLAAELDEIAKQLEVA